MTTSLSELLAAGRPLLADGATGTNFFLAGLGPGDPPEAWNVDHPDRVQALHAAFVDAGSDIILTNTFGGTRHRLQLHGLQDRVHELSARGAELARSVAEDADRPVVVAGSIGPTGELLAPLGDLTAAGAEEAFVEQAAGLRDGGVDVAWIETMSAVEELQAAARAAIAVGLPYVATASFDTAGRTMMGLEPAALAGVFDDLEVAPVAVGANCGVGASDLLVAVASMVGGTVPLVAKSNCGIPRFEGAEVVYDGDPALMARYTHLAADLGVVIVGGCCGTSAAHVAAMRAAIDAHQPGPPADTERIVADLGPLTSAPVAAGATSSGRQRRRRRGGVR